MVFDCFRGKHRTAQQDAIFVAFMERHPIISKNYLKGDKQAAEAAWKRLSNELNSVGPPVKEASEWKRVGTIQKNMELATTLGTILTGLERLEKLHSKKNY